MTLKLFFKVKLKSKSLNSKKVKKHKRPSLFIFFKRVVFLFIFRLKKYNFNFISKIASFRIEIPVFDLYGTYE